MTSAAAREPRAPSEEPAPEQLRTLQAIISGPADARVAALEAQVEDPGALAARLGRAIRATDAEVLGGALRPAFVAALAETARRSPKALADALGPVIGPAIGRAISGYFDALVETLSRTLEQSFSWRSVGWRLEAVRTGRPFAEIVLLRTLLFSVEQIFYIHADTGLLLAHAARRDVRASDPALVSGMLTAVRDFVRDSFRVDDGAELERFRVGELLVLLERSGPAVLATVVRGTPSFELRAELRALAEALGAEHGPALRAFQGDSAPFAAVEPALAERLRTETRPEGPGARRWALALLLTATLLAVGGLWLALRPSPRDRLARALAAVDGLVVLDGPAPAGAVRVIVAARPGAEATQVREAAGVIVRGADVPGAELVWIEPDLQAQAAAIRARLGPPPGVEVRVAGSGIELVGVAPSAFVARVRRLAESSATPISLKGLEVAEAAALETELRALESATLDFEVGKVDPREPASVVALGDAFGRVDRLLDAMSARIVVTVEGGADETGTEALNLRLRRERAERIRALLGERPLWNLRFVARSAADRRDRAVRFVFERPGAPERSESPERQEGTP